MKTTTVLLTALLLIFGTGSAIAQEGSLNTQLYPDEATAIIAAENLIEDIQKGRSVESFTGFSNHCYRTTPDVSTQGRFKILSVWVHSDSGFEKMYFARVGINLICHENITD